MPTRMPRWHFYSLQLMRAEDYFKIGYISKTHGLKGEVTIVRELVSPDWKSLDTVFILLKQDYIPHFIKSSSSSGDKVVVKFDEVDSIGQASILKGCGVFLTKSLRPALKRGEFYDDEVIGFEVETSTEVLGTVREVVRSGANRLLTLEYNRKEVFIPVNGPFIKSINKSKKKIVVDLPDGFLDI